MMDLQAVISSLLFGSESLNFGLKVPKAGQATYIRGYLVLEFENTGSSGHDAELASILIRVDRPSNFDLLPRPRGIINSYLVLAGYNTLPM